MLRPPRRTRSGITLLACLLGLLLVGSAAASPRPTESGTPPDPSATGQFRLYLPLATAPPPVTILAAQPVDSGIPFIKNLAGAITTSTARPVINVQLEVKAFRRDTGALVATDIVTPSLAASFPGQHTPFIAGPYDQSLYGPLDFDVSVAQSTLADDPPYRPLTIVSQQTSTTDLAVTITGMLRNDTAYALDDIRVVAELDGIGGRLVQQQLSPLAPQATAPFQLTFSSRYGVAPPTAVIIQAQGYIQP